MDESFKSQGKYKYVEQGEGPVLILLHGLFGALSNYKDVFDAFCDRYRVIIPLLPIYSLPILNTNVKSLAKFLYHFIKFKKLENYTLLGNSLGGHVALYYVNKHQDKVKSLILTGSSGLYENTMGSSFPRREDKVFIKNKVAETFYDPKHATPDLVDECYNIVNDRGQLIRILAIAKSAIETPIEKINLFLKNKKTPREKLDFIDKTAKKYFKDVYGTSLNLNYFELIQYFEKHRRKNETNFCRAMFRAYYSYEELTDDKVISLGKILIDVEKTKQRAEEISTIPTFIEKFERFLKSKKNFVKEKIKIKENTKLINIIKKRKKII